MLVAACGSSRSGSTAGDGGAADARADVAPDAAPADPCASVTCPENGSCVVELGVAACVCDEGHVPFEERCDPDLDADTLSDVQEHVIAQELAPTLLFGNDESFPTRESHWAVAPTTDGGVTAYYALAYHEDGGDGVFHTLRHLGDTEFIVVAVDGEGAVWVYLSAHWAASTDASAWYSIDAFEIDIERGPSHVIVWVGENKHANYPDDATCERGAYRTDSCSRGWVEPVDVRPDRNLGQSWAPFVDQVDLTIGGTVRTEWFWTESRFCGWQVASLDDAERGDCTELVNAYAIQLEAWELGELM